MVVPYKDVSASALCFNLVSGAVDVASLHPISKMGLVLPIGGIEIQIEAGILGASHFMTLAPIGGKDAMTEVVVCSEVEPADRRVYLKPLSCSGRIDPLTQTLLDGALSYSFSAWTEPWSGASTGTFHQLERRIELANAASSKTSTGLAFRFPSLPARQTDQPPETMVFLELVTNQGMRLQTIHSYPNDHVLVVTESKLMKGGCK
jgi:hypothetical protein